MRPAPSARCAAPLFTLLLLAGAMPAAGQEAADPASDPTEEERIEEILELRRTLSHRLTDLPEALRAEVERRWAAETGTGQSAQTSDSSTPEPAPGPNSQPVPAPAPPASATGPPAPSPAAEKFPGESPRDGAAPTPAAEPTASPSPQSPRCDTLDLLDSDGDGQISGADRYWRHLRLWRDDGDGRISAAEVEKPFELGIRRIDVRLRSYSARKDASFDIWLEELVRFDLPKRGAAAYLAIDADALARGREARLTDAAGAPLAGLQPIRRGAFWQAGDGEPRALRCGD